MNATRHIIVTNMQINTFRSYRDYEAPRALHAIDAELRQRFPDEQWARSVARVAGGQDRMVIWRSMNSPVPVNVYAFATKHA
jgi:hypothetical protein